MGTGQQVAIRELSGAIAAGASLERLVTTTNTVYLFVLECV
jgi:hypothetical protein